MALLPPGETGTKEGNIYMYIDNSNLWIQGRKTFAEKNKMAVKDDPRWRFEAGALRDILFENSFYRPDGERFHALITLYGSTPPPVDSVWQAMKSCRIKVKTFERNHYSGREKKVDAEIIADAVEDASEAYYSSTPSEFVIVSGDSDIERAVAKIVARGFPVHVWSWENGLANDYRHHADKLVHVHLLDPYLNRIGFQNSTWRGDRRNIPHHSAVVLDPEPKAKEIDDFFSRSQYPFCRYGLDEKRPEASSEDLVIIHARASTLDYDSQERIFQECKRELGKHDLTVLAWHEYSQHYPDFNAKLVISRRFPEVLDDVPEHGEGRSTAAVGEGGGGDGGGFYSADATADGDDMTSFEQVDYGTAKRKERAKRASINSQKRCDYRKYCSRGLDCTFGHTDEERKRFQVYGPGKPKKTKLCNYKEHCIKGAGCAFAHKESELFCPTCEKTGAHAMEDCPESTRNARKYLY